jgi:hypothetical protein
MPEPVYAHDALETLRRAGVTHLELWCSGRNRERPREPCLRRETVPIGTLIARYGPAVTLVMVARRARCGSCGRRGGHVQPAPPPGPGMPGYWEWVDAERDRANAFLQATEGHGWTVRPAPPGTAGDSSTG